MRIVCWQTILVKCCSLFLFFFLKIGKDVAKLVVCCSRDWRFKGSNDDIPQTISVVRPLFKETRHSYSQTYG